MATLYNKVNNKLLKLSLQTAEQGRNTFSFYKYHLIEDPQIFRDQLYINFQKMEVWGRIYVSKEGINGQVSLPATSFENFKDYVYGIPFLNGIRFNPAIEDTGKSFFKLKILVRRKILADGLDDYAFDVTASGKNLDAVSFNALTDQPSTVLVDMRNHYETEIGHFKNAIYPDSDTFREAIPLVEKLLEGKKNHNVVIYCTGGIRCEKASAWFKKIGFKHVFQLDGGITAYVKQTKEQGLKNKFIGKNFVFDERLGEQVSPDTISACHQCATPCDTHTNCKNDACHLLFLQCQKCAEQFNGCCSQACKAIIALPEEKQKKIRQGIKKGRQAFKKGRFLGH